MSPGNKTFVWDREHGIHYLTGDEFHEVKWWTREDAIENKGLSEIMSKGFAR